jgi:cation:H+ antiporter
VCLEGKWQEIMEHWLEQVMINLHWIGLLLIIVVTFFTLAKGADLLVEEAVSLSVHWGVPTVVIGATIISLGTTTPEATVSVLAALQGSPDLALGNAVGSIICDTGLILGLAALIAPLPLDQTIVNRQGWMQVGAGLLLIVACFPFGALNTMFVSGGRLPQEMGVVFLILLVLYLWQSVRWTQEERVGAEGAEAGKGTHGTGTIGALLTLIASIGLVVGSSWVMIPAVREAALRLHVPPSVIAATLVAFGTSLPELVTSVTAALKSHGELAVGNVVGADILNVLFVSGAAAAVTTGGLETSPHFFRILFPAMLFVLVVFRIGIFVSGTELKRPFGALLLGIYVLVTVLSYA